MPLYEYRCKQCGNQFEKIQSFSAPDEKECPVCKGDVEKMISAPAFQFKGSGWYVTDYSSKGGSKSAAGSSESSANNKPAATESKPLESSGSNSTPASTPSTTKSE